MLSCGEAAEPLDVPSSDVSERSIRDPNQDRLNQVLGKERPADRAKDFDDRRDPRDDEDPAVGEDPALYTSPKPRRFGFQWLRSYARNATFGFFEKTDLIDVGDGTQKLKLLRESDLPLHRADLALNAAGFDLCPENRFADQFNNGATSLSECTGTLIDKNLILTASHCVRSESSFTIKHASIDDVRVILNYALSEPGQIVSAGQGVNDPRELHFVPGRDIFRIKEVLTVNAATADFSILQLLDEDGDPVESLDPRYQPVPLWTSETAPLPRGQYRAGAAIGTGDRLPQKISLSRSRGWATDPQFMGITGGLDIFNGNSGGGVFDVETGSLVGIAHAEFGHQLTIKCPFPAATVNPWPFCPADVPCTSNADCIEATCDNGPGGTNRCIVQPDVTAEPLVLKRIPMFDRSGGTAVSKGCSRWVPQSLSFQDKTDIVDFIKSRFTVNDAILDPGIPPQHDAISLSINAVRKIACESADDVVPFKDAVKTHATEVVDLGGEAGAGASSVCEVTGDGQFAKCPSFQTVKSLPLDLDELFHTDFSDEDVREILGNSVLCQGVQPEPKRDLFSELPEIRLESGRETTFHSTTDNGTDYFVVDTDNSPEDTPDALYRIQVDDFTLLYADTFSGGKDLGDANPGTNFDTVLFVKEAADDDDDDPLLVESSWNSAGPEFDDSLCDFAATDVSFRFQSQITQILEPGKKYILGVTGFGDLTGTFNLHVQSTPAPRNGILIKPQEAVESFRFDNDQRIMDVFSAKPFEPQASEAACTDGIDSDQPFDPQCIYSTQAPLTCQRTDTGEFGFVVVSCPEYPSAPFNFRVETTSSALSFRLDDAVAEYFDGQLKRSPDGYLCSDDSKQSVTLLGFPVTFPSLSSEIGSKDQARADSVQTTLVSGAGLRTFYAHQFELGLDWQRLGFSLALTRDTANDIWTR